MRPVTLIGLNNSLQAPAMVPAKNMALFADVIRCTCSMVSRHYKDRIITHGLTLELG